MSRKGTMEEHIINSQYLNEKMTLKIYQPELLSEASKFQLCIMQDGEDYFQLGRIATLSDKLHADGSLNNTIFIGIHYSDRYDRLKKYHPEGEQHQHYLDFLVYEVVPFLDELFPTHTQGKTRTLMGDSLAGTLALVATCLYPDTFTNVIMQSPLVNDTVLETVDNAKDLTSANIYHSIGTGETNVPTTNDGRSDFLSPNRQLAETLKSKNISYQYDEVESGQHTWGYWQKHLPNILPKMFD